MPGPEDETKTIKSWMNILVMVAIIALVVSILFAIAIVVLGAFNQSGLSVPSGINLVKAIEPFLPIIGIFLGVFAMVIIVVEIIRWFMKVGETTAGGGGGA